MSCENALQLSGRASRPSNQEVIGLKPVGRTWGLVFEYACVADGETIIFKMLPLFCTGGNILIDATGQKVKLADFGTSIWLSNGYQQDNIPRGTEPFMAPEVNIMFVLLITTAEEQ